MDWDEKHAQGDPLCKGRRFRWMERVTPSAARRRNRVILGSLVEVPQLRTTESSGSCIRAGMVEEQSAILGSRSLFFTIWPRITASFFRAVENSLDFYSD